MPPIADFTQDIAILATNGRFVFVFKAIIGEALCAARVQRLPDCFCRSPIAFCRNKQTEPQPFCAHADESKIFFCSIAFYRVMCYNRKGSDDPIRNKEDEL